VTHIGAFYVRDTAPHLVKARLLAVLQRLTAAVLLLGGVEASMVKVLG